MTTITTGLFFLARRSYAVPDVAPDGQFRLTLSVRDRQAEHRVEPYTVTWTGEEARAWWSAHGAQLQPGQPLALELLNPRSYVSSRAVAPEIVAAVTRCELAPVAPSWLRRAANNNTPQAQTA
jgi:hypothetical protein